VCVCVCVCVCVINQKKVALAKTCDTHEPLHWQWLGAAAAKRESFWFIDSFVEETEKFECGGSSPAVLFAIGKALCGHLNLEEELIFESINSFAHCKDAAIRAIAFYEFQLSACRKAVCAWSMIGIRLRVMKDIRVLIGKLIWDAREEAMFQEVKVKSTVDDHFLVENQTHGMK
jgi:hypothetical protein